MQGDIDLSIILNVHDELEYIEATLNSVRLAVKFAERRGFVLELLIIFDDSPSELLSYVDAIAQKLNLSYKKVVVSNKSLGLSRNAGVMQARGRLIATADADDLVSENYYYSAIREYLSAGDKANTQIFVPEYIVGFDNDYFVAKYPNSEDYSVEDFFLVNPYGSRIVCSRELLNNRGYRDMGKDSDFAFEDWEINCYFYSIGCRFIALKQTALFYRQRPGSIMSSKLTGKIIPDNELFNPKTYCTLSQRHLTERNLHFYSNKKIERLLDLSWLIDELITQSQYETKLTRITSSVPVTPSTYHIPKVHKGMALRQLFCLTGCQTFHKCIIFSDKDQLEVLFGELLHQKNMKMRILVISLLNDKKVINKIATFITENVLAVTFLNFATALKGVSFQTRKSILMRFLLSVHEGKSCLRFLVKKPVFNSLEFSQIQNYYSESSIVEEKVLAESSSSICGEIWPQKIQFTDDSTIRNVASLLRRFTLIHTVMRRAYTELCQIYYDMSNKNDKR